MSEIKLKKWKSKTAFPFFQHLTTALSTLHQALEDMEMSHLLLWILFEFFF